jgi:hypothetical protein
MLATFLTGKLAVVAVTLVGMTMCTAGIGWVAARGAWLHPMSFVAYVVGIAILFIAGATLLNVRLPLIETNQAALIAIVALILFKVVLTQVHHLLA